MKPKQTVLAIDPGPVHSALVLWNGEGIVAHYIFQNDMFVEYFSLMRPKVVVIEQIKSYGMAVSDSVFDTVFWTGRFCQWWEDRFSFVIRVPRMDVKMHLCHDSRAKDTNIRQALIDRFGEVGTKKDQGLLYGIKLDEWAALALAVTWWDTHMTEGSNA